MGLKSIAVADCSRITTIVYLVSAFNNSKITLSSEFVDKSPKDFTLANFNTSPNTCIDFLIGSAAEDMKRHIELNFDNSPCNKNITVSRHIFASSNGHGATYHVKFSGSVFSHKTEELFIVSNLEPWCDTTCGNSFKISEIVSTKIDTKLTTMMDSFSLTVGIPYHVQI